MPETPKIKLQGSTGIPVDKKTKKKEKTKKDSNKKAKSDDFGKLPKDKKIDPRIPEHIRKHAIGSTLYFDDDYTEENFKKDGLLIAYASEDQKADPKLAMVAVKENAWALLVLDKSLLKDREVIKAALNQDGMVLQYLSKSIREDPELVRIAINQNGMAIEYALPKAFKRFHGDTEYKKGLKELSISQNPNVLDLEDYKHYKQDEKFLLARIKENPAVLGKADPKLRKDKKFIKKAVDANVKSFEYADSSIRKDREFIYELLEYPKNTEIIHHIHDSIKNAETYNLRNLRNQDAFEEIYNGLDPSKPKEKKLFIDLVKNTYNNTKFLDRYSEFYRAKYILLLETKPDDIYEIDSDFMDDREVLIAAAKARANFLSDMKNKYREDKDIVLAAVKADPYALKHAGPKMKDNKEVVSAAVEKNPATLIVASERLKKDDDLVLKVFKDFSKSMKKYKELSKGERNYLIHLVKLNPELAEKLDKSITNKYPEVKEAVRKAKLG